MSASSVFAQDAASSSPPPLFSRHVEAVFSRVGCNSGTCHGAVQGKNGFRLSLFGAKGKFDWEQIARDQAGRRLNLVEPERSLLLAKASGQIPHGGGRLITPGSREHEVLRGWLAAGAKLDEIEASRIKKLSVTPGEQLLVPGGSYQLKVEAEFADGSKEDVTGLCGFKSLDERTASVDKQGAVKAVGVGDVAISVRFRDEPVMVMALVTRPG
ncbi:MAG: Ig-like domain-containing protein, partial [Pirellulaceae bacterium]|nr:Ig-like domain-containing protein [Pirellulaceae bacterium]